MKVNVSIYWGVGRGVVSWVGRGVGDEVDSVFGD